jgi:integrase
MLETLLRQDGSATALRDLALLRVGVDSMLRSSDLVALTVADVVHDGEIVTEFATRQKKTRKPVRCDLSEKARTILAEWLAANPEFGPASRIFAITTRQHQRIVRALESRWCALFDALDPAHETGTPPRQDEEPRGGEGASRPCERCGNRRLSWGDKQRCPLACETVSDLTVERH